MKKILLITILSFTLMSCDKKAEENTNKEETKVEEKTETKSENKDFNAKIDIPSEIKKMVPIDISLTLTDKDKKIIDTAEIVVDLSMPGMEMPENKVTLKHTSDGIYKGTAIFTMKGDWLIKADIKVGDKKFDSSVNTTVN